MGECVRLLNNSETAQLLDVPSCVEALDYAYSELGNDRAVTIVRRDVNTPVPWVDAVLQFKCMGGVVPAIDAAVIRTDCDLMQWPTIGGNQRQVKVTHAQNPALRIGKENGLILLYQISTCELLAIITDGELQRLRVGCTGGGLAPKYLAREDAARVGIFGSGWQAETHLLALASVRKLQHVKVYSPNRDHREEFANAMRTKLACAVEGVDTPDEAAREVDVLMSVTSSLSPTVQGQWVKPGMHVTTVNVMEIASTDLVCFDTIVMGSRQHPETTLLGMKSEDNPKLDIKLGLERAMADDRTLADVVAGKASGRSRPDETTLYAAEAEGIQFAALAMLAWQRAEERGVGLTLPSERFLQEVDQR